jgi:eukaryotic-like serine/threonine-protein kinase
MQWVNGRTLNQYVDHLVEQHDVASLANLAGMWRDLVMRLQGAEFAHGDLQHGNVLVDEHGSLRLVDFDCSWIARFASQPPPAETGHRNCQPANRPWVRWMDTFSGLVVYLSLLTLSKNPMPWHTLNTGENLLFQRDDFTPPFETPAWVHLAGIRDPELDELAARLKACCTTGWSATGGLGELLTRRALPWWELVAAPDPPAQLPLPPPVAARSAEVRPPGQHVPGQGRPEPATGRWWDGVTPGPAVGAPGAPGEARRRRPAGAAIRAGLATGVFAGLVGAVVTGALGAGVVLGVVAALVVNAVFLLVGMLGG